MSQREQLLGASVLAVEELNDRILQAPELGKGKQLGHTYLLGHDSAANVVDAWRYDILPQLEEYYFGQFDRLRDDLLNETGDLLVEWDTERIQSFDAQELHIALCRLAGIDEPVPLVEDAQLARADGKGTSTQAEDAWAAGEQTPDTFRQRIERTLDDESQQRVERILDAGEEMGWLDAGRGDFATAQIKSDAVDPGVGPIQIDQDGEIDFRWNWLRGTDSNDLTWEFMDEAATVFNDIDDYAKQWNPDVDEGEDFVTPTLYIDELSDEDVTALIEGLRSFVDRADEFQNA